MKSSTTSPFWKCYALLPENIKTQARKAFEIFLENAYHPGLHFKKVHSSRPIFAVRISKDYRAVGNPAGDEMICFWIGSHEEYDKILKRLRQQRQVGLARRWGAEANKQRRVFPLRRVLCAACDLTITLWQVTGYALRPATSLKFVLTWAIGLIILGETKLKESHALSHRHRTR